jgi:N-methylhydantoinase B
MRMRDIDPITIATTWHYMQRVCREMRDSTERTATNALVVTLHDLAYGIWDATGRAIAIPEGFPCRLISSSFPVRTALSRYEGRIYPGDEFLCNYPPDGAVHLNDWVFVRPIFYKDELLFWTCMGTHVLDTGGAQAGSHFLAWDSIGEGLNIPLIKISERHKDNEEVLALILANNRLPDMMRKEIASLRGSTALAERRMVELLDRYGRDTVLACIDEMIGRTEKAVREEIATWPEGTYESEVFTDDDGATLGTRVGVRCELTIKDGELYFDFTESDAQVKGFINAFYQQTLSITACATFLFLGKELAPYHNEGSLAPIHVKTKKGTIVDARPGALTAGSPAITGNATVESVMTVLSQALPDRAITPYSRPLHPNLTGWDPRDDQLYVFVSMCPCAGTGGISGYDGYQRASETSTLGVVSKSDAEYEMVMYPWDIERYEFNTDSHGAGKWRGSPGIVWEVVNEGSRCMCHGGSWSGFHTQAPGQQGGQSTPFNKAYILREGIRKEDIVEPHAEILIDPGDHFIAMTGGGAGMGRPEERDPEMVRTDVLNELVSVQFARDTYKVVIDEETLQIDHEATSSLRSV